MQVNHAGFTQIVGSPTSATHVAEGMQRPCARALNTSRFDPSTGTLGKTPINVPKLFNYLPDCWEKTFILIGLNSVLIYSTMAPDLIGSLEADNLKSI